MKTFIIFILAVALAGGAFLSRPSEQDFRDYIVAQTDKKDAGFLEKIGDSIGAELFVKDCTYKDRYLWVNVEKDGKIMYTGAFSRWFPHAAFDALKKKI